MRPPRFGPKPARTDIQRFRRNTRVFGKVSALSAGVKGENAKQKVEQVADLVLKKIPIDWRIGVDKMRLFKRSAEQAAMGKKHIGCLHCSERCNLAIGLLNSLKVPAWLAREIYFNQDKKKWEVHDYVETVVKGEVHTLVFHSLQNVLDSYAVFEGPFEDVAVVKAHAAKYKAFHFRGADSQQIGGVSHWKQFEQFTSRLRENPTKEIEKNKRRVQLMIKEGIIPEEVDYQIQN
ncbi:Uncharacterised protein [uncultured archaeon]|nr:Uncharacterised protein [uncultured archaeon]